MNRRFIFIAALTLCAVAFASCSSGEEAASNTTIPSQSVTAASESVNDSLASRALVSDGLPDKDFRGAPFVILTNDYLKNDAWADEENGEVINDAVFARNSTVQERFNVKLEVLDMPWADVGGYLKKSVQSGEDYISLVAHHMIDAGGQVMNDLFLNWYDVSYVDFEKPWWSESNIDNLSYNGKAFLAIGDFSLSSMGRTFCMFYDKKAAQDYNLGDIYSLIKSGNWTYTTFSQLIKNIYNDVNGDGAMDIDDYYGFSSDKHSLDMYRWVFGSNIMSKSTDGSQVMTEDSGRMQSIVEKLNALLYENGGSYFDPNYTNPNSRAGSADRLGRDMFLNGKTVFTTGVVDMAIKDFRSYENDFGIIPIPKLDDGQERYITISDGGNGALAVPKTVSDTEMVGIITEALCAETWKTVIPAYYDVALKVKYARDEESVAMLDLIMDSRVYDFGYVYDGWKGSSFWLQALVKDKSSGYISYNESKSPAVIKHYNEVFELFEG